MSAVFELNHAKLEDDPQLAPLAAALSSLGAIDSLGAFNCYCREACRRWRERFPDRVGRTTAEFPKLLAQIAQSGDGVIPTSWGGVVIVLHEHPRVEKWLVIRQGGYLALEKHEQKDEHLEVKEGTGLILWRRMAGQPLAVQALAPGDRFHLEPGKEHCLIGTQNLLVFERSIDPKGMDQDLILIYEPERTS